MERLNYHHLLYFWLVVREGSVTRASRTLRLSQPTVSAQIHELEAMLGEKLFERSGRMLQLTEVGRVVHGYAEDIFSLGNDLLETVRGKAGGHARRFNVGVADVVPKLIARRLLAPALRQERPPVLIVREAHAENLAAQLALRELDLLITDTPVDPRVRVRVFHHLLLESEIVLLATPRLAARLKRGFPGSLDRAPFLMPAGTTTLGRSLNGWFERNAVNPNIRGEFDDSALLNEFGAIGEGVFAMPQVIEKEIRERHGVVRVGTATGIKAQYYAVTIERRLSHPAALAISQGARQAAAP